MKMNRFERRKLKRNIYKHANTIMYVCIFAMASVITILAAINRTDKIAYVDESQLASTAKESVALKNSDSPKVAAQDTTAVETAVSEVPTETTTISQTVGATEAAIQTPDTETTSVATEETSSTMTDTVKVTADTLKVRAEASLDSEILGLASEDEEYEVLSRNGEWVQIRFEGETGYVNAAYVESVQ